MNSLLEAALETYDICRRIGENHQTALETAIQDYCSLAKKGYEAASGALEQRLLKRDGQTVGV